MKEKKYTIIGKKTVEGFTREAEPYFHVTLYAAVEGVRTPVYFKEKRIPYVGIGDKVSVTPGVIGKGIHRKAVFLVDEVYEREEC